MVSYRAKFEGYFCSCRVIFMISSLEDSSMSSLPLSATFFFFGLALLEPPRVICELFHLASLFHKVSWRKLWSLSWYTFKKKIKDAYNMWAVQCTVSLRFPFIFFRVRILIELTWLLGGAFQNKTLIVHSPVLSTAWFLRENPGLEVVFSSSQLLQGS